VITKTSQDLPSSSTIATLHWTWAHTFILVQFALQILLLFSGIGFLRAPIRIAAFAAGLFLLVWLPTAERKKHPVTMPAIIVLVIMLLQFCLNPYINSVTAGVPQGAM
jgi:hypothetical protein